MNGGTVTETTTSTSTHFIQPDWPAPACIKAYTSLRNSRIGIRQEEVTPEPTVGDIDRSLLKKLLPLPHEPIWLKQTHSTIVVPAIPKNQGVEADASYASCPYEVCAVLTADCLPILLCQRDGTHVAAIHAGWRGLANGIIEATVDALQLPPDEILAWLGPAIGPSRFEVRKDVHDIFISHDPAAASAFTAFAEDHWLADIYALARQRLQKKGVHQIYGGDYCTHSEQERFFSFRREGRGVGRIVSLIWIEDSSDNL
jgi:YfiH family protein